MATTILCPYCSRVFRNSEAVYQCTNKEFRGGEEVCPSVPDQRLNDYWDEAGVPYKRFFTGRVFPLFGSKANACKCPDCGHPSRRLCCPECHNPLPPEMIEEGSEVISIIGDRSSGKTVYFVSLIHELRQHGYKLDIFETNPQDVSYNESTRTSIIYENMAREMFEDGILPQQTRATRPAPLIFRVSTKKKDSKGGRSIYLVFYDTAGEIFRDTNRMEEVARYLMDSAGVILLVDPFTMPGLRKTLLEGKVLQDENYVKTNPVTVFDKLNELVVNSGRKGLLDKPIAISFSKIDAVIEALNNLGNPYFLSGVDLERDSSFLQTRKLSLSEIDQISGQLESVVDQRWGAGQLYASAVSRFGADNVRMFAVSALGCNPGANGNLPSVRPYRVMDPLVWIMYKMGGFNIPVTQ